MKTAILLATRKGDSLAVKFLMHAPFSEVLADFKDRVANDRGEPGYDSLEIWTGPPAKTASRLASGDQDAAILIVPEGGLTKEEFEAIAAEWKSQLEAREARIVDLETELAALKGQCPVIMPLAEYFERMTDEQLLQETTEAGIVFNEDATREQMINTLLQHPKFQGAHAKLVQGPDPQGPIELPDTTQVGTGEGNLAGAQATSDEPELPLGGPPAGEAKPADPPQPGSMSPAKKKGK